jgi:hypothetical protein
MNYQPYPKAKETPSRAMRKSQRRSTWLKNKSLKKLQLKQRRLERRQLESE